VIVDRRLTPRGELALRRAGDHYEIVANGVFLMSTASGGDSERLLVRATLGAAARRARVLVGGLGVGFSVAEALGLDGVGEVVVVEIEEAVIGWHRTHLRHVTGSALADPRVRIVRADVARALALTGRPYDAVCLDVDNGPGWTVTPANSALYTGRGAAMLRAAVAPGGALGVWSAAAAPAFAALLGAYFERVDVHTTPVARGEPDHVYVATVPA
jgi:spermidine synthase